MSKPYRVESYATVDGPRELVKRCGTLHECHQAIAKAIGLRKFKFAARTLGPVQGCVEHYAKFIGPYAKVDRSGFMIFGPAPEAAKPAPARAETVTVDKSVWEALLKVTKQVGDKLEVIEAKLDAAAPRGPERVDAKPKARRKCLGRHKIDYARFCQIDAALLDIVANRPGILRTPLIELAREAVQGCSSTLLYHRLKGLISRHKITAEEVKHDGHARTVFHHYPKAQPAETSATPPNGSTRV